MLAFLCEKSSKHTPCCCFLVSLLCLVFGRWRVSSKWWNGMVVKVWWKGILENSSTSQICRSMESWLLVYCLWYISFILNVMMLTDFGYKAMNLLLPKTVRSRISSWVHNSMSTCQNGTAHDLMDFMDPLLTHWWLNYTGFKTLYPHDNELRGPNQVSHLMTHPYVFPVLIYGIPSKTSTSLIGHGVIWHPWKWDLEAMLYLHEYLSEWVETFTKWSSASRRSQWDPV